MKRTLAIVILLIALIAVLWHDLSKTSGIENISVEKIITDTLYVKETDTVYSSSLDSKKAVSWKVYGYKTDTLVIDSVRFEFMEQARETVYVARKEAETVSKASQKENLQVRVNPIKDGSWKTHKIFVGVGASLVNLYDTPKYYLGYELEVPMFGNFYVSANLEKEFSIDFKGRASVVAGVKF
ncbi:MAG: hypothetical protein LBC75_01020 [Fibromonadaceae bacterium]|jgi:hypothetical protein|nr:hypothetical protein [Fibromonadaceae bacterium]